MTLRRVSIVLLLASALVLVMGSAGFSTMAADRGVTVNVVSDDHAYVGYDTDPITIQTDANGSGSKTTELVRVSNRFGEHNNQLKVVDVQIDSDYAVTITDVETPEPEQIDSGESDSIEGTIHCTDTESATVSVTISVEATGVSAELDGDTGTREFEVDCMPRDIRVTGVEYKGLGTVKIVSDRPSKKQVKATVWVWEKNGDRRDTVTRKFKPNEKISRADIKDDITFANGNGQGNNENFDIVAVEFPTSQENVNFNDTAYIHPQWDGGEFDNGNPGGLGCPADAEDVNGDYLQDNGCNNSNNSENPGNSRSSGESRTDRDARDTRNSDS